MRQEVVSRSTSYVRSFFFSTEKFERVLELVTDFSRRNSMEFGEASRESEFVVLKERRLVPRNAVYDGMLRFSFLLETCQPGSVPDHYLMAAILDLVKIFYFSNTFISIKDFWKNFSKLSNYRSYINSRPINHRFFLFLVKFNTHLIVKVPFFTILYYR